MTHTIPLGRLRLLLLLASLVATLACAPIQPEIETGPDAEVTHDGLHRVRRSRQFQRAWIKPDANLASYSKFLTINAGIHYTRRANKGRDEFPLSETQLGDLRDGLTDAIEEALEAEGHWRRAEERGPDVLVLRVALIDVFLTSPPEKAGRDRSYGSTAGEATLIVEVFDSQSLEILARIADRRTADRDASSWRNDTITNRRAAKRLFTIWARKLVDALEFARSLGPADVAAPAEPAAGSSDPDGPPAG